MRVERSSCARDYSRTDEAVGDQPAGAEIADVNGDGIVDLLLTSACSGVNGYHSDRVFIVSSGVTKKGAPPRADRRLATADC